MRDPADRRPLKITARVTHYPPNHNAGSEWMLHSMLRPLAERGHDVTVWLSHHGPLPHRYRLDGIDVVPFQEGIEFAAHARASDVLIAQLGDVPPVASLAREYRVPMVAVCHLAHEWSYRHAAGVDLAVYNSHAMKAEAELFYGALGDRVRPRATIVVRGLVRAEDYRTTPGECVTLVNLSVSKGGELFWRIADRMPDTRFLGVLGAYGEQIHPPRPQPNLEVIGNIPGHAMRDLVYARSRVILMPSANESWGRVAVEALASGIPVIAHPTPGLAESLGHAGIFADRDDLDAWLSALTAVLEPDVWARASARALERSAELDPTADLTAWVEAVEALAGRTAPGPRNTWRRGDTHPLPYGRARREREDAGRPDVGVSDLDAFWGLSGGSGPDRPDSPLERRKTEE
ncbi:glycosyltransferase family 4 protein [Streptomyces sp. NPDC048718]|uniref:glycosyltransferase family 4 protein n=1 Tax=Streptomyces sp. NPDC048718 TaxID=3365587 RepID=UPI003721BB39